MAAVKESLRTLLPGPAARVAYLKALFENEIELRLLPDLCDPDAVSIDVGAFTGTYTIGASLHSRRVIAVEPQPQQAAALRRWVPANVEVIEAALSNASGPGWLEMNHAAGGSMSRVVADTNVPDGRIAQRVQLRQLDDLTRERVGFVKIDAEGHEAEVLGGGLRVIEHNRPSFVIEAEDRLQPGAVGLVVNVFAPFDYVCSFVYRGRLHPISEFNATTHQDVALLSRAGTRRTYADYVNNFIFMPRERAGRLPATVASPWVAVRRALAAF